jgi:hypothetical protein
MEFQGSATLLMNTVQAATISDSKKCTELGDRGRFRRLNASGLTAFENCHNGEALAMVSS